MSLPQEFWTPPPGTRVATAEEIREQLEKSKGTAEALKKPVKGRKKKA